MKITYHAPESPKLWVGKLRHVSPSVRYFAIAIKNRQRHEAYTRSAWGNGFVGKVLASQARGPELGSPGRRRI